MKSSRLTDELITRYTKSGLWENRFIDEYLTQVAAETPARPAVVDRDRVWTYSEVEELVARTAGGLTALGIGRGDVVSWQLPNWIEAMATHLAVLRLGAVSNPIIPIYRDTEVRFILGQARSKVMIVPATFRNYDFVAMIDRIRDDLPDLAEVVVVGEGQNAGTRPFDELLTAEPLVSSAADRDPNDICLLLYTSGTTSTPKGAMHSHNTLDYENRSIVEFFSLTDADVIFMPSPVGHITGVIFGLQLPSLLGTSVVLQEVWDPGVALRLIEEHRCSVVLAATPFLHGLVGHPDRPSTDLSPLRVFACGGADVSPELVRRATDALGCHVCRAYGSTEYPTAVASSPSDPANKCAETDGRALGAVQFRVVDDADRPVPAGEAGELQLIGPEMFLGYLDSGLDNTAFDADGWFRTGDLAVIDDDGFVTITGRKKDIIIRGGENISVREVEDHLIEFPGIEDVAVVGYPDPLMVERVAAVVVPTAGAEIDLESVTMWLRERHIAMQKLPEQLFVVDELPRTASGKVQKFLLRDMVRDLLEK
ncbi:AMP-binding protein (plasmid) [Pseudonocardia bannensis]|uniref:AMP-binding protein n=1 Tax=Pseudonocardia bannensis TaxID=630973 RepID=A0A848DID6_9PSEU|nr:AMP-binding protein [Pseudonocardia bannensis]NMH92450.1 AMP-binding protein [Pseudonocardia bannensis]